VTSAAGGETIQLWDVSDRHALTPTATVTNPQKVGGVVFSPDGNTLAITTSLGARVSGGTIQLWDVGWLAALSSHLHSWACHAAGGLSEDEWLDAAPGIAYQQTC
jgi:WD40 repeat protein